jgi:hypothetical protein
VKPCEVAISALGAKIPVNIAARRNRPRVLPGSDMILLL